MSTPFPQVTCKLCRRLFETQIRIDPAIYAMYPNLRVGQNTFTCPHCNGKAPYSERDFLYSKSQVDTLSSYGKQVDSRDLLILVQTEERVSEPVIWVQPLAEKLIRLVHESKNWSNILPSRLEEIVAELFDNFGYDVELTKRTRDGGRDIIAIGHSAVKTDKYLIECKHWKDKVGISAVRELLGVGTCESNSGLILVSTSGFTNDARLQASKETVKWILSLKDASDLEQWISIYAESRGWNSNG